MVVMTVRGVWLLCCLQTLPSAWGALPGGLVLLWQLTRAWGTEQ